MAFCLLATQFFSAAIASELLYVVQVSTRQFNTPESSSTATATTVVYAAQAHIGILVSLYNIIHTSRGEREHARHTSYAVACLLST